MRSRIIRWVAVVTVAGVMLQGAVASASSISVPLSQTSFGAIVVDDANQHVFISSPAGNSVAVFDFSGNLVTTLTNLPGAYGMVIVGSTLYVAEGTSGDIEEINLATLTDQGPLATGLTDPRWLAYAAGEIWATETEQSDQADQLVSITMAGKTTVYPTAYYGTDLAASPASPNDLYLSEDDLSPGDIYKLDVSGSAPVVLAHNGSIPQDNVQNLAISPDGTRVIPAGAGGYLDELSASTLKPDGVTYPSGATYPTAVAVSAGDGGLLAAGFEGYGSTDIEVVPIGTTAPIFGANVAGPNGWGEVVPHGLALSANGGTLFAVSDSSQSNSFDLWIYALDPRATATSVSATPNPPVTGQQVTLIATVAPADGGGTVAFTDGGQPISGCGAAPLSPSSAGDTAECTIASLPAGTATITAVYTGDSAYSGSSGTATFTVELPAGSNYTWNGSSSAFWSAAANWQQGSAPYGNVGTLTFPNISATTCCATTNDLTGLSADALVVNSDDYYYIGGNGISLGAGGLTAESPTGTGIPPVLALPLTLTAPQTWSIDEGPTRFPMTVTGSQGLTLSFNNGSIEPSDMDVGRIATTGTGGFYLDGSQYVNFGTTNVITLSAGAGIEADQTGNAVGPVAVGAGGWLSVGGVDNGGGTLEVGGSLAFGTGSEFDLSVDAPGTSAGRDYSQVTATGNVNLSGAKLTASQGTDVSGSCDDLHTGDMLTLLSTTGSLTGTFTNYANGATVDIANACDGGNQDATGTLAYTSNAVTLTITSGGNAGTGPPVEITAPSLSGTPQAGQTLQVDPGSWQGATSYQYSWWECGTTTCSQISNASAQTFQLAASQVGYQIGAIVTAVGPGGSSFDYTNLSATVTAPAVAGPPTVSSPPTITGTPTVGHVLTATTGTWKNSPYSYSYHWQRCSSRATGCVPIAGAVAQTYTLTSADLGSTIEVQVTAANYAGNSSPASSVPTEIVTGASASSQVTPAAVITALHGLLTPSGKAASVTALRAHHGYTFSFHAPGAGRLVVTWTASVKHKSVTVAKGSATASGAKSLKIFVRLTGAGMNALKRSTHLKVKAESSFTANGMKPIDESSSFTLSARSAHLLRDVGLSSRRRRPTGLTTQLLKRLFGRNHQVATTTPTEVPRSVFTHR